MTNPWLRWYIPVNPWPFWKRGFLKLFRIDRSSKSTKVCLSNLALAQPIDWRQLNLEPSQNTAEPQVSAVQNKPRFTSALPECELKLEVWPRAQIWSCFEAPQQLSRSKHTWYWNGMRDFHWVQSFAFNVQHYIHCVILHPLTSILLRDLWDIAFLASHFPCGTIHQTAI